MIKSNFQNGDLTKDLLKEELKQKDIELESSKSEVDKLKQKFEIFKTEYDESMQQLINEKIQKHLKQVLDEVSLIYQNNLMLS